MTRVQAIEEVAEERRAEARGSEGRRGEDSDRGLQRGAEDAAGCVG
jgi:hypothetical protein